SPMSPPTEARKAAAPVEEAAAPVEEAAAPVQQAAAAQTDPEPTDEPNALTVPAAHLPVDGPKIQNTNDKKQTNPKITIQTEPNTAFDPAQPAAPIAASPAPLDQPVPAAASRPLTEDEKQAEAQRRFKRWRRLPCD